MTHLKSRFMGEPLPSQNSSDSDLFRDAESDFGGGGGGSSPSLRHLPVSSENEDQWEDAVSSSRRSSLEKVRKISVRSLGGAGVGTGGTGPRARKTSREIIAR